MENIKVYKIHVDSTSVDYTNCHIKGLHNVYWNKSRQESDTIYNGAACLVRNADNPGCCNLCMVYHSQGSEEFANGYTVQFAPLYNDMGQMILIEYDHDDFYCAVECGIKDYDTGQYSDCILTLWNFGTFAEF